jgi:inner membrane protein
LPDERSVSDQGFSASWNVLSFNGNVPDHWTGALNLSSSQFGVDFLFPIDHYSNVSRAIKYAVMFVFLTFLVFFFIEFFNKKRMHPLQYLMVGAALVLFYLLLLSLSEHIPFLSAYLIASLAVVALIVGYTHAVFERSAVTGCVAALLTTLYSFLYTLLQMEDYALLIGSIGLFAILAATMYLTRKIDWYAPTPA